MIPESLGRDRLIPERFGSAAVTSESLPLDRGVDSNSSLPSRALSSKSLPESGWRASISSLEGFKSKSLDDSPVGTSAEEPSKGDGLRDVSLPLLMPVVKLNTSPTDYRPIKDGYMVEFRDNQFNVISELLRGGS